MTGASVMPIHYIGVGDRFFTDDGFAQVLSYEKGVFTLRLYNQDGETDMDWVSLVDLERHLSSFYGNHCVVQFDENTKTRSEKIRALTGLGRAEFCRRFGIPVRTMEAWDAKDNKPPAYVLDLLEYTIKSILMRKNKKQYADFKKGDEFIGFRAE